MHPFRLPNNIQRILRCAKAIVFLQYQCHELWREGAGVWQGSLFDVFHHLDTKVLIRHSCTLTLPFVKRGWFARLYQWHLHHTYTTTLPTPHHTYTTDTSIAPTQPHTCIVLPLYLFRWSKQHEVVEKLNMQAIMNASQQSDEFVKEFLVTYQKVYVHVYMWLTLCIDANLFAPFFLVLWVFSIVLCCCIFLKG